jgi:hypothetical protein
MTWVMAKKTKPQINVAELQPDELNALKKKVGEFLTRLQNIENELESLKEARKDLIQEFSGELDIKTLTSAMKVLKIEHEVTFKDTYDLFIEVLKDDVTNGLVE